MTNTKPDYDSYTLDQLIDARQHIDVGSHPERAAELDERIAAQSPEAPAPPYYSPEFLSFFPNRSSIQDVTDWTKVEFSGNDRVEFRVGYQPLVFLNRDQRIVCVGREVKCEFSHLEAVTVTVVRHEERPDDVGVWIKPRDEKAVRVARVSRVGSANHLAEYLGSFLQVDKIQVL